MCGIAGLVVLPGRNVEKDDLRAMMSTMVHRGPDESGLWTGLGHFGHVGLGHQRLSILDHDGGKQPMGTSDGELQLVFNGQIYNHDELRKELESLGHHFHSHHSDTEVLANGLREWGPDVLSKLNGMFSFGAVDLKNDRLILARDPMGQKPLYVATKRFWGESAPYTFAFSSELSSISALPQARKDISVTAFSRFLAMDYVPDPDCIYENVYKVPPGSFITIPLHQEPISEATPHFEKYWDIGFNRITLPDSYDECLELVVHTMEEATRKRLMADVPVGVLLSGGIDSSLVASLAARHTNQLKTFSVAFKEKSYDESSYARMMSERLGSKHHEETLDEDRLRAVLPDIADHLSEPFADHSVIPTYLLSQFTVNNVTVALGGDGGDELFLGYPTFIAEYLFGFLPRVEPAFGAGIRGLRRAAKHLPVSHQNISLDFKIQQFLGGALESDVMRRHQRFMTGVDSNLLSTILSPEAADTLQKSDDVFAMFDSFRQEESAMGSRDKWDTLSYSYARTYLAAGVLQKVDRATMAVSLEARAPLLDTSVVDLAMSFSGKQKLNGLKTKRILKDACRSLIPSDIIDRPKKGFGVPIGKWLMGPLRSTLLDLLSPEALANDELLNPGPIARILDEHLSQKRNHRKILWTLFMYRWWRTRVHQSAGK
jgi:asparagine synthase (glutamine-hydrolysing)